MLQTVPSLDLAILELPGLFIGLFLGYFLGGMDSIVSSHRIIIGVVVNVIGGLILSLLISISIYMLGSLEIVFVVLSLFGGFGLGLFLNWKPYVDISRKNHIIYESEEDDEEFDRQIEEALGGKG